MPRAACAARSAQTGSNLLLAAHFTHANLAAGKEVRMPFARAGDVEIEYDQQGAGAPLLLVHSLLTEMTVFDGMLPAPSGARRVTRLNLPGFGRSSPVVLNSVAEHADHVARAMDAIGLPKEVDVFG